MYLNGDMLSLKMSVFKNVAYRDPRDMIVTFIFKTTFKKCHACHDHVTATRCMCHDRDTLKHDNDVITKKPQYSQKSLIRKSLIENVAYR